MSTLTVGDSVVVATFFVRCLVVDVVVVVRGGGGGVVGATVKPSLSWVDDAADAIVVTAVVFPIFKANPLA